MTALDKVAEKSFLNKPLVIAGEERSWIENGRYKAKLIHHYTSQFLDGHKVEFVFEIVEGKYIGTKLGLFLPVKETYKPIGLDGVFTPKGHHSKLAKLLKLAMDTLKKGDLSISDLKLIQWDIEVEETLVDWNKKPLPESARYSKVSQATPIESLNDF